MIKLIKEKLLGYLYLRAEKKANAKIVSMIINKGGYIDNNVKLSIIGQIVVGKDVVFNSVGIDFPETCKIRVDYNARLEIGDHTGISQTSIWCRNRISIGKHVDIGAGCLIFDTNFHSLNWQERIDRREGVEKSISAPVYIGDNCFIGARCIICKGVTIGARSIIAAGSVVTKNVPEDCMAGGNPCKVIRFINGKAYL